MYLKFLVLVYSDVELYISEFENHDKAWEFFRDSQSLSVQWSEMLGIDKAGEVIRLGFYRPAI